MIETIKIQSERGRKMLRRSGIVGACSFLCCAWYASAQVFITSPTPWVTQRNGSLILSAHYDSSLVNKERIQFTLLRVSEGKSRTIRSEDFAIDDISGEYSLGPVRQGLIGGKDFLKIDWKVMKGEEKGSLAPIGVVDLNKVPVSDTIRAKKFDGAVSASAVVGSLKDEDYTSLNSFRYAMVWNNDALYIVNEKVEDAGSIEFAFDGKNGKNAFLSYPDRIVSYMPKVQSETDSAKVGKDSVWGIHYTRFLRNDSLHYTKKKWQNEITTEESGNMVVISIPWYEIGIIPFEERILGCGIFTRIKEDKIGSQYPKTAEFFTPGTWGNVLLEK